MWPEPLSQEITEQSLRAQLNLFDAVATGLAAILGAGIFAVIAPASSVAGPALLISLLIAAFVALCNALSSAQLAAVLPRTGGTYEFGRRMLGEWWGFAAGWMFLTANTVGPGVIALAFASYLNPLISFVPVRLIAVVAAVTMTSINALGIKRSVRVTDIVVVISVLCLVSLVVLGLPSARASNLSPFAPSGVSGVLGATGLLFFTYTGYSRIATLVEEVHNPRRTIPRATVIALGTATILYVSVAGTALAVLGASSLSGSISPLRQTMVQAGTGLGIVVITIGAIFTTFNEGLSDLLGVSRVAFAMGRGEDLPRTIALLGADKNPWRSVLLVGIISVIVAGVAPFGVAVAVSSFGTLLYYTVTNLSALRMTKEQRMFPRALAVAGLVGCLALAFSLPIEEIAIGLTILVAGLTIRTARLQLGKCK